MRAVRYTCGMVHLYQDCSERLDIGGDPDAIVVSHEHTVKHRVFIADDQKEMLRTVAAAISDEFQIVGMAGNGREVLKLVPSLHPEILVLDIVMPVVNGIETALRLKASGSYSKIVFLTVYEDRDFVDAAFAAGAKAYVLKSHLSTELVPAIENVLRGRSFVSACIQSTTSPLPTTARFR